MLVDGAVRDLSDPIAADATVKILRATNRKRLRLSATMRRM